MNLKRIGRIIVALGGVAMLVGGGLTGVGIIPRHWQYIVGIPFIAVGLGLMFLGTKKA